MEEGKFMTFETDRLELIPLTLEQLKLLRFEREALEKELNCTYWREPIEGFIQEYAEN